MIIDEEPYPDEPPNNRESRRKGLIAGMTGSDGTDAGPLVNASITEDGTIVFENLAGLNADYGKGSYSLSKEYTTRLMREGNL